ncbi:hypothetical protein HYW40_00840 [Candidatus Curtissbacteria bacterium]|nr:hypothetical protein [Candidatus Curtissbacteria bacterium]
MRSENFQQFNPFDLPPDIANQYREVEQRFYGLIEEGNFEEAKKSWDLLYSDFLEKQKSLGYRLHKGGIVHNLGVTALLANDLEQSFKDFVLGFAEDVASQEQGFAGEAEQAPGALNLKNFFGVDQGIFNIVRKIVIDALSKGKFDDPRYTFQNFLRTQLSEDPVRSRVELLKKTPFVIHRKHSINRIPGEWSKRVFVGGNYIGSRIGNLFEIKKVVEKKGYTPVIALEFNDQNPPIHDYSLLLLHNCKYAIFDVSADSGYLMEVERTLDYRTITLLVYEEIPEYRMTAMITSLGQNLNKFSNKEELDKLINNFLQ